MSDHVTCVKKTNILGYVGVFMLDMLGKHDIRCLTGGSYCLLQGFLEGWVDDVT